MSERKRTYLYLSGYVKEDLTEIDPILIQWFWSEKSALTFAKANVHIQKSNGLDSNLHDFHIIKCRKTIRGWVEIEGSEKHLTDEHVHDILQ